MTILYFYVIIFIRENSINMKEIIKYEKNHINYGNCNVDVFNNSM